VEFWSEPGKGTEVKDANPARAPSNASLRYTCLKEAARGYGGLYGI